jgi:NADPH-dependent ferric siderophore reductase
MSSAGVPITRSRREPPAFRRVTVRAVAPVTSRLVRVTLGGPELDGLVVDQPAARVRLLLPPRDSTELVMPAWTGNEFLLPDGSRPAIRTLTPLRLDPERQELEVEIVVHEGGTASGWALAVKKGDEAALSGPGRGYPIDPDATMFLLAGDESALPAIGQLLEALPAEQPVRAIIEVAHPDARLHLPARPAAAPPPAVEWYDLPAGAAPGDALVAAVVEAAADLPAGARVWAAGEAAAVQRIRRHLLGERGLPRSETWIRGYWKHGRAGDADEVD